MLNFHEIMTLVIIYIKKYVIELSPYYISISSFVGVAAVVAYASQLINSARSVPFMPVRGRVH